MKDGYYLEVSQDYDHYLADLRRLRVQAEQTRNREMRDIQQKCLDEHGSHNDNGSFMMGFCTRCGACLG